MCVPDKSSRNYTHKVQRKNEVDGSAEDEPESGRSPEHEQEGEGDYGEPEEVLPRTPRAADLNQFVDPSFKVARSSRDAAVVVEQWVNRALDMGVRGLVDEFRSSLARWQPETMTTVAYQANTDKNRYLDVPCQDYRRVILNWPGLPNDYIHANYVANPTQDRRFICAQGPLESTQLAFWAMVIQEGCEAIIMLCNTVECGKFKCSQYWPREKGEVKIFGEGDGKILITNLDVRPLSVEDSFVRVCQLKLEFLKNGQPVSQIVRHYQWENWPDRGVPPTRLTATNILSEVRGSTKPILVHCSAGIGRTGSIVAIAYVQEKMQHGKNCMNMDALTKELRTQRPFSIQNEMQYIYVHRVLLAYFLEKYRERFQHILNGEGEAKYAKWLQDYKAITGCD
uniref:Protein-tyrosine phosphatase n=1 Tax=Haemonchus contortus TaxID=6289 RepID=A0A7I4YZ96_HAECO